ncbi:hypothetical protein [Piscirickettsia litoralis]|uniref:Prevent-host-death protein n=2 Tax=Piscirickettsia litoralis TaxID=1891921 RepID=A0ABX2ZXK6_9GAMM|nr:hypothetical protein [Piscirickettsia litoralis]ODN40967.1 hypothetical protein BGC07_18810 [Piscirickettsia litoralis]ODN41109.1 hypothetical protein BGC07_18190 [Piscirickettsia litoralis]
MFNKESSDKFARYTNQNDESVVRVSASDLQQNLKEVTKLLTQGCFVEITKHRRTIGMIVPY